MVKLPTCGSPTCRRDATAAPGGGLLLHDEPNDALLLVSRQRPLFATSYFVAAAAARVLREVSHVLSYLPPEPDVITEQQIAECVAILRQTLLASREDCYAV
jgi:hypothetical protein